jgi:hypothetical protein
LPGLLPPRDLRAVPRPRPETSLPPITKPTSFRRTLVRVLAVQIVTLLLLWFLQARFG